MSFELAQRVADAVLYEGYVLYPYRASATKNRVRWQFGVVVPRGYSEGGESEPWAMQTECLLEPGATARLDVRVRFLQVQARTVEEAVDSERDRFRPVEALEVGGQQLSAWDEGVEGTVDQPGIDVAEILARERAIPIEVPGGREVERVRGPAGEIRGRIVRERWPISGLVRIAGQVWGSVVKVRVRIENSSAWTQDAEVDRHLALRRSLIGTHTLLAVRDGAFVSLLDPPRWAVEAAASCANLHTWPVLIGLEGRRDVMLSSPIILYDYPAVAPESPGDFCDATEIDELLTLRIMTLTAEEKQEARGTDERARQIIERSDAIPPELFDRLHGAIRSLETPGGAEHAEPPPWGLPPDPREDIPPEEAWMQLEGMRVSKGSRVRVRPRRRADSMDMFFDGRAARVEGVYRDVEDQTYVAVTLEDDPGGDLHRWYGRFLYFHPEEIEPLDGHPPDQERRE